MYSYIGESRCVFLKVRSHYCSGAAAHAALRLEQSRPEAPPLVLRRIARGALMTVLMRMGHNGRIVVGHTLPKKGEDQAQIEEIMRVLATVGVNATVVAS